MQASYEHNAADPFGEFRPAGFERAFDLLGARFEFRSHSAELIALVDAAYAGLPQQRLEADQPPLRVALSLIEDDSLAGTEEPPSPRMQGGAGQFGAIIDGANFAFAAPGARGATVSISRGLLMRHRYHARYELLEFAVFMLASRAQGLIPLHAACVGWRGQAALLVGESGAGKTTLSLQSLLDGMEFLTEDAVFIDAASLRATGVANYLHPRFDALRFVQPESRRAQITASPVIRRRSGVEKYELDLRTSGGVLAEAPLKLTAIVMLSAESAGDGSLLRELAAPSALERLRASQPYAAQLQSWAGFEHHCLRLQFLELRRGSHPREGVAALRDLLSAGEPR
ncbi:hypothetical protein ACFJGW_02410 [Burkholderiaceae bacterium UC74_6]